MSSLTRRRTEAVLAAAIGGALGSVVAAPLGLAALGAGVGATNGLISGWRSTYQWGTVRGNVAFALDSTWALPVTASGVASHAVAAVQRDGGFDPPSSERQNRHVYRRGFVLRRGFVITVGNVVSGAGDVSQPRRRRLVTDHEDVHVWQSRWFGPTYPLLYAGWMVAAGAYGGARWLLGDRPASLSRTVETYAYYLNPFEWWAYSRDDNWPPSGKVAGIGWQRPLVSPRHAT
ncbi:MAG: hypothetical protein AAGA42_17890 [Actinomycetota bacterium]